MSSSGASLPTVGILTISDRASAGDYEDLSGPAIETVLREYISTDCVYERRMIPDEIPQIVDAIRRFAQDGVALVCTTGGTGPTQRDVTPEAMEQVCTKFYPGFGEEMRRASLAAGVPTAILSRQLAGSLEKTLVVNLPGKPAAVRVCLDAVFPAIPFCIELLGGPIIDGPTAFRPKKK